MTKILIVDDDPGILKMTATMLELGGFEYIARSTADAALEALDHGAVDAVVTDIQMPGMNGQELILHIKAMFPKLPIVAVSGSGSIAEPLNYAQRLGASAIVPKPFTRAQLTAAIDKVLHAH